jgi:sugar lactone lactonase YvrE
MMVTMIGEPRIEVVVEGGAQLGESPVWDTEADCLWWVDIKRGHVHRHAEGEPDAHVAIGEEVGAVALRRAGGLVLATRSGVVLLDALDAPARKLAALGGPGLRCNDAFCDPAGRLWAGTLADDGTPGVAALYRVEGDGKVTVARDGISVPNGIDVSPDATTLYHVDSATQRVDAYELDLASGALGERRTLVDIAPEEGIPDGLTVDAEGHVWLALFGGATVLRIAPDGTRDRTLRMPVSHPTSCAFGGEDLGDLYVTSAAKHLAPEQRGDHPLEGAVLRLRPGARGLAPHRFAA